jgi:hypothetical protein
MLLRNVGSNKNVHDVSSQKRVFYKYFVEETPELARSWKCLENCIKMGLKERSLKS